GGGPGGPGARAPAPPGPPGAGSPMGPPLALASTTCHARPARAARAGSEPVRARIGSASGLTNSPQSFSRGKTALSRRRTRAPAPARRIAAVAPAGPPPAITNSGRVTGGGAPPARAPPPPRAAAGAGGRAPAPRAA